MDFYYPINSLLPSPSAATAGGCFIGGVVSCGDGWLVGCVQSEISFEVFHFSVVAVSDVELILCCVTICANSCGCCLRNFEGGQDFPRSICYQ